MSPGARGPAACRRPLVLAVLRAVRAVRAVREGKGELASSLFHAGAGIPGIQQILQQLETEAEDLFKPRGSTSTLNKAFAQLEQHRDALRKEEFSASDWKVEKSG